MRETQRAKNIPVLVDSRFRLSDFSGFTAATPNEDEVEHLIGAPIDSATKLETAAESLKKKLGYKALLVTRGASRNDVGAGWRNAATHSGCRREQAVDGTGAGDTVIATFALALASGSSFGEAAQLANHAGGLVVMKRGTASITATELEQSINDSKS